MVRIGRQGFLSVEKAEEDAQRTITADDVVFLFNKKSNQFGWVWPASYGRSLVSATVKEVFKYA